MPSVIDPNVLVDNQPVDKASLRQTLGVIKQELEHGGFATVAGGNEQRVVDALAGRWVDVRSFGVKGDGSDDTLKLQDAVDSGLPLYLPPGTYRISAPLVMSDSLRMRGAGGKQQGGAFSRLIGTFAGPLIRWQGVLVDENDVLVENTPAPSGGQYFIAEDMLFTNDHIDGCCIQTYNCAAPTGWYRCGFEFEFRGLLILQGFENMVFQCVFDGAHFTTRTIADGVWRRAHALYAGGHTNVIGTSFRGCGTGITASGAEVNIIGSRIETCGAGLVSGVGSSLAPDIFGQPFQHARSLVSGLSFESNHESLTTRESGVALTFENIGIQGGTNGPDGVGAYGAWLDGGNAATTVVRNLEVNGQFLRFPAYIAGAHALEGVSATWKGADGAIDPPVAFFGGSTRPLGDADGDYDLRRFPLNGHVPGVVTAHSDLQLRGLKGLDILDKTQPNNLGGLEAVAETATSHAVQFRGQIVSGFNQLPTAGGAGSALAAGTYFYAQTVIGPRGETGVDGFAAESTSYRSVVVGAGQQVTMSCHDDQAYTRCRWYRGRELGRFDGFYETEGASFTDVGAPFDGYGAPPHFTTVPSQHEADANYAVVALPSWDTRIWVSGKATSGFTLNFSAAAPPNATIQWLLFRP